MAVEVWGRSYETQRDFYGRDPGCRNTRPSGTNRPKWVGDDGMPGGTRRLGKTLSSRSVTGLWYRARLATLYSRVSVSPSEVGRNSSVSRGPGLDVSFVPHRCLSPTDRTTHQRQDNRSSVLPPDTVVRSTVWHPTTPPEPSVSPLPSWNEDRDPRRTSPVSPTDSSTPTFGGGRRKRFQWDDYYGIKR